MDKRRGRCRIGTSGFHYPHWREIYYPRDLPAREWLARYACDFDTVELNNTFYRLPPPASFDLWRTQSPPGFEFALKFSRYGSHILRLKQPAAVIGRFLEPASRLGDRLGPILVQLPPNWNVNRNRLEEFFDAAPAGYRWAVEFRDARWLREEVYSVLRRRGAALCIHDKIADHPREITAGWVYMRFHGGPVDGNYSLEQLRNAAVEIQRYVKSGLDVYAYFNNDWRGYALRNAQTLRGLIQTGRSAKKTAAG